MRINKGISPRIVFLAILFLRDTERNQNQSTSTGGDNKYKGQDASCVTRQLRSASYLCVALNWKDVSMVDREQNSQGLYTPELEHDACGIGFVAHLKNRKSHEVVTQALDMLARMEHRGGQGCDPCSGDG
uniref:hypothetical protein n=1 Tax=Vibrio parahaemolyticus TaxID=670 RepID=UPI0009AF6100